MQTKSVSSRTVQAAFGSAIAVLLVLGAIDGLEISIEDSVAPILDREGHATGAVIVFRDVSAPRAMAQQMTHSAEHDFLTGLPNRMLLNDRVSQAISAASRQAKKVAVLFLDLDGFKHSNDFLGHPIGDKLLQSIAKHLVDCVRGSDTVRPQGGDEFVVLLSEVEHSEDAAIAEKKCCGRWRNLIPSPSMNFTPPPASA
jgi:GGDEF domain-containing protein